MDADRTACGRDADEVVGGRERWVVALLDDLLGPELVAAMRAAGAPPSAEPASSRSDALSRWEAAGLARLTGRPGGPALPPPPSLVDALRELPAGAGLGDRVVR